MGIAIAGPLGGSIAEQVSYHNMFGIAGALTFLAIIIFLTLSNKTLINSLRFAFGRSDDDFAYQDVQKAPVFDPQENYPVLSTTGIAAE